MHIVNNDMKIINNKKIDFISGYLEALTDIDGKQKEFFTRSEMLHSLNDDCTLELKELFEFILEPKIIKKKEYSDDYALTSLLQKLLLIKPFSGLYLSNNKHGVSENTLNEYRDYVIFHLTDYIDMAFEEEGIEPKDTKKMNLLYVNDNDGSFIVLIIISKNTKLLILFFRENYTNEEFEQWFDDIRHYSEDKIDKYTKRKNT